MNREQRFWYLDELVTQGLAAQVAFDSLQRYVSNEDSKQTLLVWSALSSFLAHTGVISKILFPPRGAGVDRATNLIETLKLPNLPSLQDRTGRNNVEHIDERIDNWAARDANHIVSIVVPDREGYEYLCTPDKAIRRVLIENEMVYVSEDSRENRTETSLQSLFDETSIVLERSHEKMQEDPPYHILLAKAVKDYAR